MKHILGVVALAVLQALYPVTASSSWDCSQQQRKDGSSCHKPVPAGQDSLLLQMDHTARSHKTSNRKNDTSDAHLELAVPKLKPEWAAGFKPNAADVPEAAGPAMAGVGGALVQEGQATEALAEEELQQRARPTTEEWQHFQLVKALRARGFTCPDGTRYAPNNGEFEWDCRLQRAAEGWSTRMATEGFEGHRYGGSEPCQRTEAQGFPRMRGCGENLALGRGDPGVALVQLQESNEHCKNMMDPQYNKIGVGYVYNRNSRYQHYWTDSLGSWHQAPDQSCIGGSPAPSPAPGCADLDTQHCLYYRDNGYCETSDNVKRMCKDTCRIGNCGSPQPAQPSPSPSAGCADSDGACDYYRRNGYCSTEHIQRYCRMSCGLCGQECTDIDGACAYYRANGYCSSDNVKQQCRRSCGVC